MAEQKTTITKNKNETRNPQVPWKRHSSFHLAPNSKVAFPDGSVVLSSERHTGFRKCIDSCTGVRSQCRRGPGRWQAVSPAGAEQHLYPAGARRHLLARVLGPPALGEGDAHGAGVDGARVGKLVAAPPPLPVLGRGVGAEDVEAVAGRHPIHQQRPGLGVV